MYLSIIYHLSTSSPHMVWRCFTQMFENQELNQFYLWNSFSSITSRDNKFVIFLFMSVFFLLNQQDKWNLNFSLLMTSNYKYLTDCVVWLVKYLMISLVSLSVFSRLWSEMESCRNMFKI